ncbi:hypothetical protein OEZ86_010102 [Tetradesmus obliquus]|uniref:CNNM transmembrane domain-containing protein n=1 Tax=Tetradesmus obliquus TaxID=3088 RepID=A0ABY8UNS6_TETOB|nr:hypothetical protein OEZ85_001536 [Tetradesmus obliquus]WIA43664.1 hypothetical protein OEZ86_010102 [Tetradesmus obliquus]
MLAVQTGGRLLLQAASSNGLLPDGGELSQQQRLLFGGISVGLTVLAGLMSGLTLGLMSLDAVELEVLKRSGSSREKQYAAAIAPLIQNTHFLLVTLLLCNACAMEALPLFLDTLTDPATAILVSVTAVLVFGEVLPQAVCSRYGLAIGYYCSWLVRALMAATSPISWPLGRLLDWMLGAQHTALYRRGQLKALVDIHAADEGLGGPLLADEIKVMVGALDLTHKTAATSMTPLAKVLMLPAEARYDAALLAQVLDSGHSRLPVFTGGDRRSIVGLVLVKDLLRHAPDGSVALGQLQMRPLPRVPADTPMYDMFKLFQTGRSHMVLLTQPPAAPAAADGQHPAAAAAAGGAPFSPRPALLGCGDASGVPLGIITIEDVIEELMQTEIVDETDLFVDNEQSISVNASSMMQGLPAQLRSALAQQHHHTHNQQHQQHSASLAGAADAGAPVSAAAAAAAVSTMRKLVRKVSSRSREHGSSGGGAASTPSAALAPGGDFGGAAAAAAARVSDSSVQVSSHDTDHTQPLLSHDRS